MAKAKKTTNKPKPKKKVSKYHEKFKVDGSFDEVMKVLANPTKK
jgi:hypothetical protein